MKSRIIAVFSNVNEAFASPGEHMKMSCSTVLIARVPAVIHSHAGAPSMQRAVVISPPPFSLQSSSNIFLLSFFHSLNEDSYIFLLLNQLMKIYNKQILFMIYGNRNTKSQSLFSYLSHLVYSAHHLLKWNTSNI